MLLLPFLSLVCFIGGRVSARGLGGWICLMDAQVDCCLFVSLMFFPSRFLINLTARRARITIYQSRYRHCSTTISLKFSHSFPMLSLTPNAIHNGSPSSAVHSPDPTSRPTISPKCIHCHPMGKRKDAMMRAYLSIAESTYPLAKL